MLLFCYEQPVEIEIILDDTIVYHWRYKIHHLCILEL